MLGTNVAVTVGRAMRQAASSERRNKFNRSNQKFQETSKMVERTHMHTAISIKVVGSDSSLCDKTEG